MPVPELETDLGRWVAAGVSLILTFIVVAILHALLRRATRRHPNIQAALQRTHRPTQVIALVTVMRITVPPLLEAWEPAAAAILSAGLVVAIAWLVGTVLVRIEEVALRRFRVDVVDNLAARRMHTQVSILRRVTVAVVAVLAAGAVLLTFPPVRAAGASLLASAGVIGVVAALAAQSTLGNLFAGLNLAFGNSLRLDDVVVVEGEWGRIEEITLSYVVVRIWDQRRLILPSSYFTTTPFQNWTRTSADVIGTIDLDVDWSVPVEEMREAARRVVEASDLWDRRAFGLQITEATGGLVRARVLVSAANSSNLWDLRCLVRERLVTWLQREHPDALPRSRTELHGLHPDGGTAAAAPSPIVG
jgi:small-conductance mechanosensitive channel